MRLTERCLRLAYRAGARLFYGSGANADWIYEKVQRPRNVGVLALNFLYYYLRRPKIGGIVSLILEPVSGCNLRCTYCRGKMDLEGRRPYLMSWETFCRAIDTAPRSVESVALCAFGEPLLHPRICDMIDYIRASGRRVVLYSNCTLLTGERLDQLAKTDLSVLSVSIEPDAETSRKYRGVDLDEIRRNVETFARLMQPETEIKLSIVAHPGNIDRIDKAADAWRPLVEHVKVGAMVGFDGAGHTGQCAEPWRGNIVVFSNGKVSPCCVDLYADLVIGDVNESSLSDMIRAPEFARLLDRFIHGPVPDLCARCGEFAAPGVPAKAPRRPHRRRKASP